tara:strand:- start:891 stop:2069 length:1179 start_codon:yes stop_codon:yes gene_type:complete
MSAFDPKKTLKKISNTLLQEFFSSRKELLEVPWDNQTEHKIDPIYKAWQALAAPQLEEVQLVMRDVAALADERGVAVLIEELMLIDPGLKDHVGKLKSRQDIVLWIYLHAREAFDQAVLFARADRLSFGRYWYRRTGLPTEQIAFDPERLHRLEAELSTFYRNTQMRGHRCKVDHYPRHGGNEYLFAYLEDHPDRSLGFVDGRDELSLRSGRAAFENVFVLNANEGTLEMFVEGGKRVVDPLFNHICRGIWDRDIESSAPQKPSYSLDHFLDIDHPLPTDPAWGVRDARITRMRITQRGSAGYLEVKADRGATRNDVYRRLERQIQLDRFPQHGTKVLQVSFQLEFDNGRNKRSTMSFDVSVPNSCTLKSKPDSQRVVGEKCLKQWGVIHDG